MCHWTSFPNVTCVQALEKYIGYINLTINWKRIKWDKLIAFKFRYGQQTSLYADLTTSKKKLTQTLNIGYKYFNSSSCTLYDAGKGKKGFFYRNIN